MRRFYSLLILVLVVLSAYATPVDKEQASNMADAFMSHKASSEHVDLKGTQRLLRSGEDDSYYLFSYDNAWVIVSGDTDMYPVLGYSLEGKINHLPPAMESYLNAREDQAKSLRKHKLSSESSRRAWQAFERGIFQENSRSVDPLVETKWNQGWPYNAACPAHPAGPGGHVYAGCVATAMGQIMNYYEYPETGRFSTTVPWGEDIEVDFSETTYDWDVMGTGINSQSQEAISTLLFHCGAAVDMNYSSDGSGSNISTAEYALKYYFRYKPGSDFLTKSSFLDTDWRFMLKEDIDKQHPVLYRGVSNNGGGHAFVCDGYQDTSYFHFNWGWSGSGDGYFHLDGMDFHWSQGAVFNISPYWGEYCSSTVYTQAEWSFGDGSGPNFYWNDTDCEWLIQPEGAEQVKISFSAFQTMQGDVLQIYDGATTDAELIGSYSGGSAPGEITSSGPSVLLRFMTNSDGQSSGWELNYESVTTSLGDFAAEGFNLYPNPASDALFVQIPGDQAVMIRIYSADGRVLLAENHQAGRQIVDISDLPSGMYFLQASNDNTTTRKHFIVK